MAYNRSLVSCVLFLSGASLLFASSGASSAQEIPPAKPQDTRPAPASPSRPATLLIAVDAPSIVVVDGEQRGRIEAGSVRKVGVEFGDHLVVVRSSEVAEVEVRKVVTIGERGQKLVSFELEALVERARREKDRAEDRLSADESEIVVRVGSWILLESDVGGLPESRTLSELEDLGDLAGEVLRVDRERLQQAKKLRQEKLEAHLLELEALRRGVSTEELLRQEVELSTPAVTEAEIQEFWRANSKRISGPLDQQRPKIREYLAQRNETKVRSSFIRRLEERFDAEVRELAHRVPIDGGIGPSRGSDAADVTIVEFGCFECPYTARVQKTLRDLQARFPEEVRLVFRHFPLNMHQKARFAAEAAACAEEQDLFWPLHDALFADQSRLDEDQILQTARKIGADVASLSECIASGRGSRDVERDLAAASLRGVMGTPAFFLNGRFLNGAQPLDRFVEIVQEELRRVGP